jgi:hypothetical protein
LSQNDVFSQGNPVASMNKTWIYNKNNVWCIFYWYKHIVNSFAYFPVKYYKKKPRKISLPRRYHWEFGCDELVYICLLVISRWCDNCLHHSVLIGRWCDNRLHHSVLMGRWCDNRLHHSILMGRWCDNRLHHSVLMGIS